MPSLYFCWHKTSSLSFSLSIYIAASHALVVVVDFNCDYNCSKPVSFTSKGQDKDETGEGKYVTELKADSLFPTKFCHPKLNASLVLTHTCNEAMRERERREGEKNWKRRAKKRVKWMILQSILLMMDETDQGSGVLAISGYKVARYQLMQPPLFLFFLLFFFFSLSFSLFLCQWWVSKHPL